VTSAQGCGPTSSCWAPFVARVPRRVDCESLPTGARPEFVVAFSCITADPPAIHAPRVASPHVALPERYPLSHLLYGTYADLPSQRISIGRHMPGHALIARRASTSSCSDCCGWSLDPLLVSTARPRTERQRSGTSGPAAIIQGLSRRTGSLLTRSSSGCCVPARTAVAVCACRAGAAGWCAVLRVDRSSSRT
jgi:hypothetical protein